MNGLVFFALVLRASLLSTGGFGNIPALHADLLSRGWASERTFVESLSVGQVSPGPNGLWIVSLGYLIGGLPGAALATLAIALPPLLILAVDRLYQRVRHHVAVEGFVRGLSLAVVGVFAVTLFRLLGSAVPDLRTAIIGLAALGLATTRRVPGPAVIALAAAAGILL